MYPVQNGRAGGGIVHRAPFAGALSLLSSREEKERRQIVLLEEIERHGAAAPEDTRGAGGVLKTDFGRISSKD